jgi:hypothetical protein
LGNFTQAVSTTASAKRFITLMRFPPRRATDREDDYRYCTATLYLQVWKAILGLVNNWRGGFWLGLLGEESTSILVPRIGSWLGDLMEMRSIAATSASFSVRCHTALTTAVKDGSDDESEEEDAVAEPDDEVEGDETVDTTAQVGTVVVVPEPTFPTLVGLDDEVLAPRRPLAASVEFEPLLEVSGVK